MITLETEMEIGADGSVMLLSALPGWLKPGRVHVRLTLEDGFSGIEKAPNVNGGDACLAGTRIPVWTLEEMRRAGMSEADILSDFPGLRYMQLRQGWDYVKTNAGEIEEALTAHARAGCAPEISHYNQNRPDTSRHPGGTVSNRF